MKKTKIGIPRALLYYKYQVLWRSFFENLGCEVVVSPNTNKQILQDGDNFSIDESCLSAKIFMGHVNWLIDKVDYILIPRVVSYKNGDITCTKFHALYDIVKTTFPSAPLIDYNVDFQKGKTEIKAYVKMGLKVTPNVLKVYNAYKQAKRDVQHYESKLQEKQDKLLASKRLKILIASHPYNAHDEFVGKPIVKYLKQLGADVLFADIPDNNMMIDKSKALSKTLYWRYNKEIVGAIEHYKSSVDGIIFLTTFPCGPDSLVVELLLRKLKGIPMTNIIVDSLQGETGMHTRIESFIDIIIEKKKSLQGTTARLASVL